jgi:hypothetical protein
MSRREEGEMKKYAVALWVAVWVIGLTSGCGGEDQADKLPLRLNLREGESLSLRMVTDQNISQTVLGQEQEITQKIGFDFTFLIDAVDADGTAMVQVTYDWVMMEQDGPTGKIVYDSADPPARVPDLAVGFAALVGRGFAMRLSAEGRVQDIQGVDALITGLLEELDLPEGAEFQRSVWRRSAEREHGKHDGSIPRGASGHRRLLGPQDRDIKGFSHDFGQHVDVDGT